MTSARPNDSWNSGDPYELYVERWSHLVANEFLAWLNLPSSLRWLEVGCGTGALTAAISEKGRPARLIGIDPSEGFLAKARARLEGKATFRVANALDIPLQDSEVDVVVSGLVLNFVPNPALGLAEMRRTAIAGGTIAAYVWDYAGKMEFMRYFWDAAVELNRRARELDEGVRFPLCQPDAMENAFNMQTCRRSESRRLTSPVDFGTSTITGSRSSGGKGRRLPTQCPWMKRRAIDCEIEFANACPLNPMDRSRLSPGHGRSRAECPDDATPNQWLENWSHLGIPTTTRKN